jgi:hypothetical protein
MKAQPAKGRLTKGSAGAALPKTLLPQAHSVRPGQERLFPAVRMLINAERTCDRARQLQSLPDGVVSSHGHLLIEACRQLGFEPGAVFMEVRLAALFARRRIDGTLDPILAGQLDYYRAYFALLARAET